MTDRCTDPSCLEHWPTTRSNETRLAPLRLNGEGMWEFTIPMPPNTDPLDDGDPDE